MPRGKKASAPAKPKVVVLSDRAAIRNVFGKHVLVHDLVGLEAEWPATFIGHDPYAGTLAFERNDGRVVYYHVTSVSFSLESPAKATTPVPRCGAKAKSGSQCVLPLGHDGKHRLADS